jgi:hypothetical protein
MVMGASGEPRTGEPVVNMESLESFASGTEFILLAISIVSSFVEDAKEMATAATIAATTGMITYSLLTNYKHTAREILLLNKP